MTRSVAIPLWRAVVVGITASAVLAACAVTPEPLGGAQLTEIMQLREDRLRELADAYGLTDVARIPELVRWVSPEEVAATEVACLGEAGFPAELIGDGGIGFDTIPDEQKELGGPLHLAMWTCEAEYSVDPRTQIALNDDQYQILLTYLDTTYRDCLRNGGVDISEAPSLKVFMEGYEAGTPWVPWSEVSLADVGQATYAQLQKDCPQAPPSVELYGPPLPQPGQEK